MADSKKERKKTQRNEKNRATYGAHHHFLLADLGLEVLKLLVLPLDEVSLAGLFAQRRHDLTQRNQK
jgi:hypothetical protein